MSNPSHQEVDPDSSAPIGASTEAIEHARNKNLTEQSRNTKWTSMKYHETDETALEFFVDQDSGVSYPCWNDGLAAVLKKTCGNDLQNPNKGCQRRAKNRYGCPYSHICAEWYNSLGAPSKCSAKLKTGGLEHDDDSKLVHVIPTCKAIEKRKECKAGASTCVNANRAHDHAEIRAQRWEICRAERDIYPKNQHWPLPTFIP